MSDSPMITDHFDELKESISNLSYHWQKEIRTRVKNNDITDTITARSLGKFSNSNSFCKAIGQKFLPLNRGVRLEGFSDKIFCGKFSTSGENFLGACQNAIIYLFKSSDLHQFSLKGPVRIGPIPPPLRRESNIFELDVKPYKEILCRDVSWAVVGVDFSPDDKWLAYSTWSDYVHLCNVTGDYEMHEALDFSSPFGQNHSLCLFSIQFSPANTHLLGGANDYRVHLYNLERKEIVNRFSSHEDDVNTICYLDKTGNVFLSGSDDCNIKVWDIRISCENPVGSLRGHGGGITCIVARTDGYTVASNAKDQTLKLWDTRLMAKFGSKIDRMPPRQALWDYRFHRPHPTRRPSGFHPFPNNPSEVDLSLKTFTGHSVLQTLIRCTFSPEHTTGQRYILSASKCGKLFMWDILTGESIPFDLATNGSQLHGSYTVRDVSWHPHLPLIASSSWDTTIGLWSYGRESSCR